MVEFYQIDAGQKVATAHWVPDCCASILDKKVQGVALNYLEQIADWLLTCLSSNYVSLFGLKIVTHHHDKEYLPPLLHFPSGVPLYSFSTLQIYLKGDVIVHGGLPVHFNQQLEPIVFSKKQTDYVMLELDAAGASCMIYNFDKNEETHCASAWKCPTKAPGASLVNNQRVLMAKPDNMEARALNRSEAKAYAVKRGMQLFEWRDVKIYADVRQELNPRVIHNEFFIRDKPLHIPLERLLPDGHVLLMTDDPQKEDVLISNPDHPTSVLHVNFKDTGLTADYDIERNTATPESCWEATPVVAI